VEAGNAPGASEAEIVPRGTIVAIGTDVYGTLQKNADIKGYPSDL
jgi:hypothetical protein